MSDLDIEIFNNVENPEPGWASTLTPGFELFDVNEQTFAKVSSNDIAKQVITLIYREYCTEPEIRSYVYIQDCCAPIPGQMLDMAPNVRRCLVDLLWQSCSSSYAAVLAEELLTEVTQDVCECADYDWNEDDVRLALGRVLIKRLRIEDQ